MTAYEFTRMESDFTKKVRISHIDREQVNGWMNERIYTLRSKKKYIEARDIFMEVTMSCDNEERIGWMKFFMDNAIAYGIYSKDTNWVNFYSAAYDILNCLLYRASGK